MSIKMSVAALAEFLDKTFPQVAHDFVIERVTDDGITVRLKVADRHLRPGGTVSGPTMFALADVSIYLAILSRIGPQELAVTTNASIDFMRKPDANTDLIAQCSLLKLGRLLAVGDVLIYSQDKTQPVARASMSYALPVDSNRSGAVPERDAEPTPQG